MTRIQVAVLDDYQKVALTMADWAPVAERADITVLSLADSPFLPWEDPVSATVLGGSPERIVATLVGGDERYRRGGRQWHASTSGARRARARMLGA